MSPKREMRVRVQLGKQSRQIEQRTLNVDARKAVGELHCPVGDHLLACPIVGLADRHRPRSPFLTRIAASERTLVILNFIWFFSLHVADWLQKQAPLNRLLNQLRKRENLRYGPYAMLLAIPHLSAGWVVIAFVEAILLGFVAVNSLRSKKRNIGGGRRRTSGDDKRKVEPVSAQKRRILVI